jgi:hypothetical protein
MALKALPAWFEQAGLHLREVALYPKLSYESRKGAENRCRTDDLTIFSRVLYQLSYLGVYYFRHIFSTKCPWGESDPRLVPYVLLKRDSLTSRGSCYQFSAWFPVLPQIIRAYGFPLRVTIAGFTPGGISSGIVSPVLFLLSYRGEIHLYSFYSVQVSADPGMSLYHRIEVIKVQACWSIGKRKGALVSQSAPEKEKREGDVLRAFQVMQDGLLNPISLRALAQSSCAELVDQIVSCTS